MSQEKEIHPEEWGIVNRRVFLLILAVAAIGAVDGGMLAVREKAPSLRQVRGSNDVSISHPRGGHLYMQTNETKNAVVHYRWSTS